MASDQNSPGDLTDPNIQKQYMENNRIEAFNQQSPVGRLFNVNPPEAVQKAGNWKYLNQLWNGVKSDNE